MLKRLFTSKARIKLLETFMMNPDGEFFIRELTRLLNEQINSVRRELGNLKSLGLLRSRMKNRKKFYIVNKHFVLFNELRAIILKSSASFDQLAKKIQKCGEIDLLVISGAFIDKNTAADLFIVGNVNKAELNDLFTKEFDPKFPVKTSVMSREDFLYRMKINDKFVKEIVNDTDNVIAINHLEKYLEEVV